MNTLQGTITYPTFGNLGKSSTQKCHFWRDTLVPWRGIRDYYERVCQHLRHGAEPQLPDSRTTQSSHVQYLWSHQSPMPYGPENGLKRPEDLCNPKKTSSSCHVIIIMLSFINTLSSRYQHHGTIITGSSSSSSSRDRHHDFLFNAIQYGVNISFRSFDTRYHPCILGTSNTIICSTCAARQR